MLRFGRFALSAGRLSAGPSAACFQLPNRRQMSDKKQPLSGKVCLVTGASRGLGKGIAIELGKAGATVYVTGRKAEKSDSKLLHTQTSLESVAEEITKQGGKGKHVYCDHADAANIKALFQTIEQEQDGRLDILVNNAFSGVFHILQNLGKKFYEINDPAFSYDIVNDVGLRNNYISSVHAARLMTRRKQGLIVNISSIGSVSYLFNIPYGFGKEALSRMSADMAIELKDTNVKSICLIAGAVQTEIIDENLLNKENRAPQADYFAEGESIFFPGKALVHLASDEKLLQRFNGRSITTTALMDEFGLTDVDGKAHRDPNVDKYKEYLTVFNDVHLEQLR